MTGTLGQLQWKGWGQKAYLPDIEELKSEVAYFKEPGCEEW